jgi:mono/diheme cytochrome c family protein
MTILRASLLTAICGFATLALGGLRDKTPEAASQAASVSADSEPERWMVEGEKRYRTNCGRCHQPPHKLPPRAMAMAIRHMRVRGMLTEDDMKYVFYYMTH